MKLFQTCIGISRASLSIHKFLHNARIKRFNCCVKQQRNLSSTDSLFQTNKIVYISTSRNIYENLALEEWLYENVDLTDTDYLLMWRNDPAIVIGRHQNPWQECDVQEATKRGIALVRRNSGGGTVYHDRGNLNLSFLMHRSRYDRRRNLSQVVAAVTSRWDLDLDLNCRDDLVLDGVYKVSGTASKLGGSRTYHHFTLVFDVNTDILSSILRSPLLGADSRATRSIPSPVKNLTEDAPDMTYDLLVKVIGQRFMEGMDKECSTVDPTDESRFPGVSSIQRRLASWDWVFGKTPRFTITRTFVKSSKNRETPYENYSLRAVLEIDKGRLQDVSFTLTGRLRGSVSNVHLPFVLLHYVDVAGERLERGRMERVWERCRERLREREGEEDYDMLMWGLDCLVKCTPVGFGSMTDV